MGLASAVFALGTRTLIASVTPVNDADTRTLMLTLHDALSEGPAPAAALTEASERTGIGGFVCLSGTAGRQVAGPRRRAVGPAPDRCSAPPPRNR